MSNLFGLEPVAQELLQPSTFQSSKFAVKELVETLADAHSNKYEETLDPKPYIRTFEASLAELRRLQAKAAAQVDKQQQACNAIEKEHSLSTAQTARAIEDITKRFAQLDSLVAALNAETHSKAVQLQAASADGDTAKTVAFLIKCFLALYKAGACSELTSLWDNGALDDRQLYARTLRQLQLLTSRVAGGSGQDTDAHTANGAPRGAAQPLATAPQNAGLYRVRAAIDELAEQLETELYHAFDTAYSEDRVDKMKESAEILTAFNSASSVVQLYVNMHAFFMEEDQLAARPETLEHLTAALSDYAADPALFTDTVKQMCQEIAATIEAEITNIALIFPNAVLVLKVFVQRVFGQRVQQQLEVFLGAAEGASLLAYVRVLHACHTQIGRLVAKLKELFSSNDKIGNTDELNALLDQNFADIFMPYIDNHAYFDAEQKSLSEVLATIFEAFNAQFASDALDPQPRSSTPELARSNSSDGRRVGQFMKAVRLERHGSNTADKATKTRSEVPIVVNTELVQDSLKAITESINRCIEMSNDHISTEPLAFFKILMDAVAARYVDEVLSKTLASAPVQSFACFPVISKVSAILLLISMTVKTVIIGAAKVSPDIQKEIANGLNAYIAKTEAKINSIVLSVVDTMKTKLRNILLKQKKKDLAGYVAPLNNGLPVQTPCAKEICELLDAFYHEASQSFDDGNLEPMLTEVGTFLKDILLDQIRKMQFSPSGAQILSHDLLLYQETIDRWSISSLSKDFASLHSIGALFTAQPQALGTILNGTNWGMKSSVLHELVRNRADYSTHNLSRYFSSSSVSSTGMYPYWSA